MTPWRRPDRWARLHRSTALLVGDDARLQANRDEAAGFLGALDPLDVGNYWAHERVLLRAVGRARAIGVRHPAWDQAEVEVRSDTLRRGAVIDLLTLRIVRELRDADIQALALKGPQLAERLHGGLDHRDPSADIDLLVPATKLSRAHDLVAALGWSASIDPVLENGLPVHHLELGASDDRPHVELHWRIQFHDEHAHAEAVLSRGVRHRGLTVASPEDQLGILLLTWARDGFRRLRLAADVAAWWETYGAETGRAALGRWEGSQLERPLSIAASAASDIVGTPGPARVPGDRAARLARRIASTDRPRGRRSDEQSLRSLLDVLTCPVTMRGERFARTWALHRAVSQAAHPWAPSFVVPLLRATSASRTAIESVPIVTRAWRLR